MEGFSFGRFVWWMGVVEDRMDPEKLGRVRVRVFGYHTKNTGELPTDNLMWATVMQPTTSAAISGIGSSPNGLVEGSHVVGFFMDGDDAQVPVIMGSIAGKPETKASGEGFNDPSGKFPRYTKESDINRLARSEKLNETIQEKKKQLDTANGVEGKTWQEPASPYSAKYPFNKVLETESGHVQEFDDTEGAERIHTFHKSGTFEEIHPDGSRVVKIVKDNYTIVAGDDFVHVLGDSNIHVSGSATLKVNGDLAMEVDGNMSQKIGGNLTIEVGGNKTVEVGGAHFDRAGGDRTIRASRIYEN